MSIGHRIRGSGAVANSLRAALFAVLLGSAGAASAAPGGMVGLVYDFGRSVGVTIKLLSSNHRHRAVGEIGVSYFPFSRTGRFGLDVGGGYNLTKSSVTVGWDFLGRTVQIGAGYVNTVEDHAAAAPPPAPPPPIFSKPTVQ